jgi:hypothetical protein
MTEPSTSGDTIPVTWGWPGCPVGPPCRTWLWGRAESWDAGFESKSRLWRLEGDRDKELGSEESEVFLFFFFLFFFLL